MVEVNVLFSTIKPLSRKVSYRSLSRKEVPVVLVFDGSKEVKKKKKKIPLQKRLSNL